MMTAARRFGPALEALHVFIAWAAPVVQAWRAQADFAHAEHLQRAMLRGLPEEVRKRPRGQRKRRREKSGGD